MEKRLQLFLAALTDEELHLIEKMILEMANHGETAIILPKNVCDIADDILNY